MPTYSYTPLRYFGKLEWPFIDALKKISRFPDFVHGVPKILIHIQCLDKNSNSRGAQMMKIPENSKFLTLQGTKWNIGKCILISMPPLIYSRCVTYTITIL